MGSELLTLKQVMERFGVSREVAERLANESGAALPRRKHQPYLIREAKLLKYLEEG